MIVRFIGVLLLGVAAALLTACAKEETASSAGGEQVSTIPWNRPEKWEGQGMLGGFQGSR